MARKNDSPQKAAMRQMMRDYLKNCGRRSRTCKEKRKENQRGLGILPYGNFIIRTVGKYGEFRPCVRTWAVLAILPTTLPKGVSILQ